MYCRNSFTHLWNKKAATMNKSHVRYCNNLQLYSHLSDDFKSEYLGMSHWALENTDQAEPTPTLNQAMSTILREKKTKKIFKKFSKITHNTIYKKEKLWMSARLKLYIH